MLIEQSANLSQQVSADELCVCFLYSIASTAFTRSNLLIHETRDQVVEVSKAVEGLAAQLAKTGLDMESHAASRKLMEEHFGTEIASLKEESTLCAETVESLAATLDAQRDQDRREIARLKEELEKLADLSEIRAKEADANRLNLQQDLRAEGAAGLASLREEVWVQGRELVDSIQQGADAAQKKIDFMWVSVDHKLATEQEQRGLVAQTLASLQETTSAGGRRVEEQLEQLDCTISEMAEKVAGDITSAVGASRVEAEAELAELSARVSAAQQQNTAGLDQVRENCTALSGALQTAVDEGRTALEKASADERELRAEAVATAETSFLERAAAASGVFQAESQRLQAEIVEGHESLSNLLTQLSTEVRELQARCETDISESLSQLRSEVEGDRDVAALRMDMLATKLTQERERASEKLVSRVEGLAKLGCEAMEQATKARTSVDVLESTHKAERKRTDIALGTLEDAHRNSTRHEVELRAEVEELRQAGISEREVVSQLRGGLENLQRKAEESTLNAVAEIYGLKQAVSVQLTEMAAQLLHIEGYISETFTSVETSMVKREVYKKVEDAVAKLSVAVKGLEESAADKSHLEVLGNDLSTIQGFVKTQLASLDMQLCALGETVVEDVKNCVSFKNVMSSQLAKVEHELQAVKTDGSMMTQHAARNVDILQDLVVDLTLLKSCCAERMDILDKNVMAVADTLSGVETAQLKAAPELSALTESLATRASTLDASCRALEVRMTAAEEDLQERTKEADVVKSGVRRALEVCLNVEKSEKETKAAMSKVKVDLGALLETHLLPVSSEVDQVCMPSLKTFTPFPPPWFSHCEACLMPQTPQIKQMALGHFASLDRSLQAVNEALRAVEDTQTDDRAVSPPLIFPETFAVKLEELQEELKQLKCEQLSEGARCMTPKTVRKEVSATRSSAEPSSFAALPTARTDASPLATTAEFQDLHTRLEVVLDICQLRTCPLLRE